MRYYKTSCLSFALTVAFSCCVSWNAADAQAQVNDFPWRANAKSQTVAKKVQSIAKTVQAAAVTPQQFPAKAAAAVSTVTSQQQLPEFFYDQGKKYIRQGDVYVESPTAGQVANAVSSASAAISNGVQKQSMFSKAKSLTTRLNPFTKIVSRNPVSYKSKDWDVPSFSKSLSFLDKKPTDPITFAAVTALPAKTAMPSAIDGGASLYAARDSYSPATSVARAKPSGVSHFSRALPTETAITPVVASSIPKSTSDFSPVNNFVPATRGEVSVFDSVPAQTKRTASLSADGQFWSPQR